MKNRMTIIAVAAVGIGAVSTAAVATQAAPEAETFRLVEINGAGLPALVEEEDGCREEIVAGAITLEADGDWVLITREREVCGGRVEEEEEEREEGTYEAEGDDIRFFDDDDDDAHDDAEDDDHEEVDVDDLATGSRAADGLTVRLEDGGTLTFRR